MWYLFLKKATQHFKNRIENQDNLREKADIWKEKWLYNANPYYSFFFFLLWEYDIALFPAPTISHKWLPPPLRLKQVVKQRHCCLFHIRHPWNGVITGCWILVSRFPSHCTCPKSQPKDVSHLTDINSSVSDTQEIFFLGHRLDNIF